MSKSKHFNPDVTGEELLQAYTTTGVSMKKYVEAREIRVVSARQAIAIAKTGGELYVRHYKKGLELGLKHAEIMELARKYGRVNGVDHRLDDFLDYIETGASIDEAAEAYPLGIRTFGARLYSPLREKYGHQMAIGKLQGGCSIAYTRYITRLQSNNYISPLEAFESIGH